jgi:hypothetical protein
MIDLKAVDFDAKRLFQKLGEVLVFLGISRPGPIFETVSKFLFRKFGGGSRAARRVKFPPADRS